jgi:hypothetical protein
MGQHDRAFATGLVGLLLLLWGGFLVHRSPDFAGTGWGGVLGVSGAALMLVPLAYSLVKRIAPLRRAAGSGMRTFLVWHIYAGLAGAALALAHTGHKFQSPLGVALTAMLLLVVLSGFVGRYLLGFVSEDLRDKQANLAVLKGEFDRALGQIVTARGSLGITRESALPLVDALADLELGVRADDQLRRWFSRWLKCHLVISGLLYVLLGLHIWAALRFGLRWFGP